MTPGGSRVQLHPGSRWECLAAAVAMLGMWGPSSGQERPPQDDRVDEVDDRVDGLRQDDRVDEAQNSLQETHKACRG